jgi:hypothetical protein
VAAADTAADPRVVDMAAAAAEAGDGPLEGFC